MMMRGSSVACRHRWHTERKKIHNFTTRNGARDPKLAIIVWGPAHEPQYTDTSTQQIHVCIHKEKSLHRGKKVDFHIFQFIGMVYKYESE